nr:hypothetical protein BdHM001_23330 [Bdellovibrio sp. HM001]
MTPNEISNLILIIEACSNTEIESLIKMFSSDEPIEIRSLPINERTKNKLLSFFKGKTFSEIRTPALSILMCRERFHIGKITPVFTTPKLYNVKLATIRSKLIDLINSAERSIYLFGFWMTDNSKEIAEAIAIAHNRGVKVILIADSKENFIDPFMRYWRPDISPSIYIMQKDDHLSEIKMHAKTIIVDERKLLLSSANLTFLGMNHNVEIGAVIESREAAEKICDFLQHLIHDSQYFRKLNCLNEV